MFHWIAANWLTIVCAAVVLGLVAVSLWNILPHKGKPSTCAGCAGCASCSGGCAGCSGCASRK
ncbi:MAG: FeoB-associated Cys-rich membrane protein [Oscillospiraceae bacterium]|nr:FeoB-associated Cys-rich membrane protein [Oscillospiraceae bacterium]